ncbi:MAG: hypothetical protein IJG70_10185 [Kiritimatiellae bacterium]|nr:hypothetical protein [Kiritimatiellia bacterium]
MQTWRQRWRFWRHRLPDVVVSLLAVLVMTRYAATKPTNQLENCGIVELWNSGNGKLRGSVGAGVVVTAEDIARGYRLASVSTNASVSYSCPTNGAVWASWARRGAFRDWFTLAFPAGWTFPLGSNELSRATVFADARIRPSLRAAEDEIAALGSPASAVPGVSEFWSATGSGGSQLLTWRDFFFGRGEGEQVSAQIELSPSGDFAVRSNSVERAYARIAPFDWDGDGLANDVDPEPCVSSGDHHGQDASARESVLEAVGIGLENGWYFLSATFPEKPVRPTLLSVGTNRMVVVESGEYLFLLEKGIEYDIHVEPWRDDVVYDAFDDVLAAQNPFGPMLRSIEWWGPGRGDGGNWHGYNDIWTEAPGGLDFWPPGCWFDGYVAWWPGFKGSPDIYDLDPHRNCVFTGVFTDCHVDVPAQYEWKSAFWQLPIVSPHVKTTEVLAPPAALSNATILVTATYGGREYQSFVGGGYHLNTNGQVRAGYYVGVDPVVFRGGARRPLVVFAHTDDPDLLPLPTNGTLTLSFESGSDHVRLWSAEEGGSEVSLPRSWPVTEFDYFTCYVEGLSASENVGDVEFRLSYSGEDGSKEDFSSTTCAEVKWVHLQSSVAGSSPNPPPFEGQTNHEFNVRHSPSPDKHLPVFFEDVKGEGFEANDFSVRLRLEILPSGFSLPGVSAMWEFLEPSPNSGSIVPVNALEADFVNPKVGGVYHIGVTYYGSPMSECNIVLPLAGAEVADLLAANIVQASNFVQKAKAKYSGRQCTSLRFGWKWFIKEGNGDYLGRPDNAASPTIWFYNQVSDDTGMGAVATLYGVPIRAAKLSNFMVGYASSLLGIGSTRSSLAQLIGTSNDQSASMSWDAGVNVASGSNFWHTVSNLSHEAWGAADSKNRRLWPNKNNLDNAGNPIYYTNFNRVFYPPGFLRKTP